MLRYLIAFSLLLTNVDGLRAWPENVRHYQQCSSCHVSPSGGGVLTEYGKGLSAQLATINNESFGPSNYSAFKTPKQILIGGNVRNLHIEQYFEDFERERTFLMQADLELALQFKSLTFVGSIGYYGLEYPLEFEDRDTRRYYAMLDITDHIKLRLGKFFTNFGLMIDDHTEAIRSRAGYNQGQETRNYELGYYSELFNLVGTLEKQEDGSFEDITTISLFPGKMIIGASLKRDKNAIFAASPITKKAYVMAEYLATHEDIYYLKSGYELYRGIVPYVKYSQDSRETYSLGTQLHLIAHLEFLLESSWSEDYADFTATSNYYF